jgi:hypothetical protein
MWYIDKERKRDKQKQQKQREHDDNEFQVTNIHKKGGKKKKKKKKKRSFFFVECLKTKSAFVIHIYDYTLTMWIKWLIFFFYAKTENTRATPKPAPHETTPFMSFEPTIMMAPDVEFCAAAVLVAAEAEVVVLEELEDEVLLEWSWSSWSSWSCPSWSSSSLTSFGLSPSH